MIKRLLLAAVVALLLSACAMQRNNPAYDRCINTCTTKQDKCMINASSAESIDRCKARLQTCTNHCIATFPRWIPLK